jgi:hypothetical protein
MSEQNPDSRSIDVSTQEGLDRLKIKAKYYGHYAEQLKVTDLIKEIERLKSPEGWTPEVAVDKAFEKK